MSKMLGIIGGMGAFAGLDLLNYAFTQAARHGASKDEDFPSVLFYNLPAQGMNERGVSDQKLVKSQLRGAISRMESFGCEIILIACNTVYSFYPDLQGFYSGKLLNMIDVACSALNKENTVGVMCSETSRSCGLYATRLKRQNRSVIECDYDEQTMINHAVDAVISGRCTDLNVRDIRAVVCNLKARGAESVIVGCTELPLVLNGHSFGINLIDAGRVSVDAALSLL